MKRKIFRFLISIIVILIIAFISVGSLMSTLAVNDQTSSSVDGGTSSDDYPAGTSSEVDAGGVNFTLGEVNTGGESKATGISGAPQPYYFGNYYCTDHKTPLTRTEDGNQSSAKIVQKTGGSYAGEGETVEYYNQEIDYTIYDKPSVEQSIAAAFYARAIGIGTVKELQNVIWSSGQWNGKENYVENLHNYTGLKISADKAENALYERAEAWANFYYNLLMPSGGNLKFNVTPIESDGISVYVDQNARTFAQGSYTISLLDKNGNDISNNKLEYYSLATSVGDLLYKEISGQNPGINAGNIAFQFAKLKSATATVTYTDGTTDTYNIEILDENGNTLVFPKLGEKFYVRIEVPSGEDRTVHIIQPHISIEYLTRIPGTAYKYKATATRYEITDDFLTKLGADVNLYKGTNKEGEEVWIIGGKTIAELKKEGFSNAAGVLSWLQQKLIEKGKALGYGITGFEQFDTETYIQPGSPDPNQENSHFTSVDDFEDHARQFSDWAGADLEDSISNKENAEHWIVQLKDKNPIVKEDVSGFNEDGDTAQATIKDFDTNTYEGEYDVEDLEASGIEDVDAFKNFILSEMGLNPLPADTTVNITASFVAGGNEYTSIDEFKDYVYRTKTAMTDDEKNEYISDSLILAKWHYSAEVTKETSTTTSYVQTVSESSDVEQRIVNIQLTNMYDVTTPGSSSTVKDIWTWASVSGATFNLFGRDCTVEIGGKVWVDVGATKESSLNGRLNSGGADTGDYRYAGMEVTLHLGNKDGNQVRYAITDSNGGYHFYELNALEDYTVVFKFNGQLYQQTYYKEDLSGGFSNAQEVDRARFNDIFDKIDSYPSNYNLYN